LKQIEKAKSGTSRPVGPSIADGYNAVSRLTQQHKHLDDHEIAQLVVGYRADSTILELAARFGCDRKTVIRYLKLHCVETRYRLLSEVEIDEAAMLYQSGRSLAKLGKRFGVNPKTVKARLLERGVIKR
jgi:AraC-like DNA-binding protein